MQLFKCKAKRNFLSSTTEVFILWNKKKPFDYKEYNKKYYRKSYLDDQIFVHISCKHYLCFKANCTKKNFFQAEHVNHVRMHTFCCFMCHKSINNIGSLKQHLQSHEPKNKCPICSKSIAKRCALVMYFKACRWNWNTRMLPFTFAIYRRQSAYRLLL